jgi:hypothetical protein
MLCMVQCRVGLLRHAPEKALQGCTLKKQDKKKTSAAQKGNKLEAPRKTHPFPSFRRFIQSFIHPSIPPHKRRTSTSPAAVAALRTTSEGRRGAAKGPAVAAAAPAAPLATERVGTKEKASVQPSTRRRRVVARRQREEEAEAEAEGGGMMLMMMACCVVL